MLRVKFAVFIQILRPGFFEIKPDFLEIKFLADAEAN
jgi:hypothetical protein